MKPALISTLVLFICLATSCQKDYVLEEIDDPLPGDTTQTPNTDSLLSSDYGGLLAKIIYYYKNEDEEGSDSLVVNYIYDSQNRLIEYNDYFKNIENPTVEDYGAYMKIIRDPNGAIKEVTLVNRLFETPGDNEPHYDVRYEFNYNQTLSQYKYAIMTGFEEGNYQRDSIVYDYDNAKHIIKKTTYGYNSMDVPTKFILYIAYDNDGNIIRRNQFFEYEGQQSESFDNTYFYDDKMTPGNFEELSTLIVDYLDNAFPAGKNNLVGGKDRLDRNGFANISYTYNAFNKPAKAVYTYDDSDDKAELIYFYRK